MTHPENSREAIIETVLPESESFATMIQAVDKPQLFDQRILEVSGRWSPAIAHHDDALIGGVYLAAKLDADKQVETLWMDLASRDPAVDLLRDGIVEATISAPNRLNARGVLNEALTYFAIGSILDDFGRRAKALGGRYAPLGALEIRGSTDDSGRPYHYLTLSSSRMLRRSASRCFIWSVL